MILSILNILEILKIRWRQYWSALAHALLLKANRLIVFYHLVYGA